MKPYSHVTRKEILRIACTMHNTPKLRAIRWITLFSVKSTYTITTV